MNRYIRFLPRTIAFFAVTCVLLATGCTTALFGLPTALEQKATVAGQGASSSNDRTMSNQTTDSIPVTQVTYSPGESTNPLSGGQQMAQAVDELEQIRLIDSEAHARLLADLAQIKPKNWPSMVTSFHSALRFRLQLAEDESDLLKTNTPATHVIAHEAHVHENNSVKKIKKDEVGGSVLQTGTTISSPVNKTSNIETEKQTSLQSTLVENSKSEIIPASHAQPLAMVSSEDSGDETNASTPLLSPPADPNQSSSESVAWQSHLAAAIRSLASQSTEISQSTSKPFEHARLKLLQLAAGESDSALGPMPGVSPHEQDYWSKQLSALSTYVNSPATLDKKHRARVVASQLEEAAAHLKDTDDLTVRNMAFCKRVYGFGAYEEYSNKRFKAGDELTLYAEVESSHCEATDKGYYTTLASSYKILDEDGRRIDSGQFPDVEDYCRNRRRDFHIQYGLSLPDRAASGHYRLQLTIEDNQSQKIGQDVIPFEIVGR